MKAAIILLICLFLSPMKAKPDDNITASCRLAQFVQNAHAFNQLLPQEKVYLHFDNTDYFLGETIWFKAYVVAAEDLRSSEVSKVLYVELLNQEGNCVETKKLKIESGQCHGEFFLHPDFRAGFYELRAYTRAMLNFGEETIFSRIFPVYNEPEAYGDYRDKDMRNSIFKDNEEKDRRKEQEKKLKKENSAKEVNVAFFPEGGNLVQGIPNRIAFRATGKKGEALSVTGNVLDSNKQVIETGITQHQGMGVFSLPSGVGQCTVEILHEEKAYHFDLPAILPSGYVLNVDNSATDSVRFSLKRTPELLPENLGISIACRGKIIHFEVVSADTGSFLISIAKETLPAGVNTVTLLRSSGEVLAERLFFINQPAAAFLSCTPDKEYYRPLEKIQLAIKVEDALRKPVPATVSLSVRDASSCSVSTYRDNINTNLLLSSDLKGYIEQPDYYFASEDPSRQEALDLLMLTQGWRRYDWQQKHPVEESLMIKGRVIKYHSSGAQAGVQVNFRLSQPGDRGYYIASTVTDADGNFTLLIDDSLNIRSRWDLIVGASRNGRFLDSRILIDRQFSPPPKGYAYYETMLNDSVLVFDETAWEEEEGVRSLSEIQHLNEVLITSPRKLLREKPIIYNVDKDINDLADAGKHYPPTIGDYLQVKEPSFEFHESEGFYGPWRIVGSSSLEDPLRKDFGFTNFHVERVEKVYVYRNPEAWRTVAPPNVRSYIIRRMEDKCIYFYSVIKKNISSAQVTDYTRFTYFDGYSNVKEFPQTVLQEPVEGETDHRRTLYWNPNIEIGSDGKASVSFYNNTSARRILLDCEGITSNTPIKSSNY